ncbi:hypothetical protein HOY82DRAFT_633631, partial [Tuber indicum]
VIRLSVAENKGVAAGLVNHLTNVWRKLQTLSNQYEKDRCGNWDKPRSPDMPKEVGLSLKIEIFRDIYKYSLKKQMNRIEKWSEDLRRFAKVLVRRSLPLDLVGFELSLYEAVLPLLLTVRVVSKLRDNPDAQLTESEWELVYFQSILANERVRIILVDSHVLGCEALARELRGHPGEEPFPLRRALEKLTSLPRHIESLLGFAHSPRLRPALQYQLSISAVPKMTQTVKLPASTEEWKSFVDVACHKRYDFRKAHAVELVEKFGSRQWVCPVHCECALIQYFHSRRGDQWDRVPPVNYIGVSKLSCSACHIWIEAFNDRSGRKFYTGGSHGKWYWPWGVPRAEGPAVELMVQRVRDKYLGPAIQKLVRAGSESSGASSNGVEHGLSDDHRKDARAVHDAIMQDHGGSRIEVLDAMKPDA